MGAAASRYTEVKLSKMGAALTQKLNENIVPMVPNYDGTEQEPEFLYAPVPLLLNTGAFGIGVGMAVSIPSHNLNEILDATVYLLNNPHASTEDLLKFIKGPDLPSGCAVVNQEDFLKIYKTGQGSFLLRGSFEFNGNTLVIRNMPMYTIAAKVEEQIYKAKDEGFFKEIVKIVNTTAQKQELTIQLKSKFNADDLIREICRLTDVERTVTFDLRAVDKGRPQSFTLLTYLRRWLDIHQKLVTKELTLNLHEVERKLEINEGLQKALMHIDEIIATIKSSNSKSEARTNLINMGFSELQANAILDIKLSKLTRLEAVELAEKIADLQAARDNLKTLLSNSQAFKEYISKHLLQYKGYDITRVSPIENTRFPKIVKVKQDKVFLTYSQGVIKVTEEMPKTKHFIATTKNPVYLLADNYIIPVKNTKELIYTNVHGVLGDEDIFHFSSDGYVKRTKAKEFKVSRKAKATGQEQVHTVLQGMTGYVLITTKTGKQVQFDLAEVPYSKRGAKGVIAVKLDSDTISKIELVSAPVKGVPKGRNRHLK